MLRSIFRLNTPAFLAMSFALIAMMALVVSGYAHAATDTAANTKVGLGGAYDFVRPYLLDAFMAIVTGALTWAAAMFNKATGLKIAQNDINRIQTAALNAAGRIMANASGPISNIKFDLRDPRIAVEVERVQDFVEDEVKRQGLSPDRVATLIQGKIGQLQAASMSTATAPPVDPAGSIGTSSI